MTTTRCIRCAFIPLLVLFAALATACGPAPQAPDTRAYPGVGTWVGTISDRTHGTGSLQVVLPQPGSDRTYRGTWTTTFPGEPSASGIASGSAAFDPVPLMLLCAQGGSIAITASIQSGRMTGDYFAFNCGALVGGSVNVVRQ